jgi:hypothetical protein
MEQFTLIDAKVYDAPAMNTVPIRLIENDLPVSVSGSSCSFSIMPVQTAILNFINNQYLAVNEISTDLEISVNTEGEYIRVKADDWLKVSVYNMQGVRIAQQEGMKEISIKIKDRGIYIVKTSFSENGTQMKKIFF